jgi:4-hydroxy-3-methylbut-2-en-1-yl diphosphate synthase IspG/GcpE
MKSAIGIGALLMDGLGDTIRVSLTGEPSPLFFMLRKSARLLYGIRPTVVW